MTSLPEAASAYRLWRSSLRGDTDWSPELGEGGHGPHVAMRRAGCEPVSWRHVAGPVESVRVLAHTCECLATVYELCSLGGTYFIRRTVRGPSGDDVHESPRTVQRRVEETWFRLLRGRAR